MGLIFLFKLSDYLNVALDKIQTRDKDIDTLQSYKNTALFK